MLGGSFAPVTQEFLQWYQLHIISLFQAQLSAATCSAGKLPSCPRWVGHSKVCVICLNTEKSVGVVKKLVCWTFGRKVRESVVWVLFSACIMLFRQETLPHFVWRDPGAVSLCFVLPGIWLTVLWLLLKTQQTSSFVTKARRWFWKRTLSYSSHFCSLRTDTHVKLSVGCPLVWGSSWTLLQALVSGNCHW